jgi:hypothetical protein
MAFIGCSFFKCLGMAHDATGFFTVCSFHDSFRSIKSMTTGVVALIECLSPAGM